MYMTNDKMTWRFFFFSLSVSSAWSTGLGGYWLFSDLFKVTNGWEREQIHKRLLYINIDRKMNQEEVHYAAAGSTYVVGRSRMSTCS